MQNKVYTYYEWVPGLVRDDAVMKLWRESWQRHGWEPRLLARHDANKHPRSEEFMAKVRRFPTRNPVNYDLVCWYRWLAFARAGGGLMTDMDTINHGLTPDMIQMGSPMIEEMARVPCMVSADAPGAEKIVTDILAATVPRGIDHYSDMIFFQASDYPYQASCRELGHEGWESAGAVHFSRHACRIWNEQNLTRLPKREIIRRLIPCTVSTPSSR